MPLRRLAIVATAALSLTGIGEARAAGATPVAPGTTETTVITQAVHGGGTATIDPDGTIHGQYTTGSQLGIGHFTVHSGPVDGFPSEVGYQPTDFTRSDGMVLHGVYLPEVVGCGIPSPGCDLVTFARQTSDITGGTLHLALGPGSGSSFSFIMFGSITLRERVGYAMVDASGNVSTFGGIDHLGDANPFYMSHPTAIELTPSREGYWILDDLGEVFTFGDAPYDGEPDFRVLFPGERVTSFSATPSGNGYWLFTSAGRALRFGDAKFFGDLSGTTLNGSIIGSIATPTGKGYYMVGSDGGVFAFGDAKFRGSMGGVKLNQPVLGIVPTPNNDGYWLVARDGGVFSFNAPFLGSMGAVHLNQPIATMVRYGAGYLMVASDGGVFNFSKDPFFGSLAGTPPAAPIVGAGGAG